MRLIYKLRVRSGPDKGMVLALEKKETVIGRGEGCDLPISDAESSRRHCKVVVKGRKVEVVDMGSTNGTKVNGRPVDKAPLATGGVITIGDTEILLFSEERREEGEEEAASAAGAGAVSLLSKLGGLGLTTKILLLMILLALLSQVLVAWPLISRQRGVLAEEAMKQAAVLVMALAAANREGLRQGDEMMIDTRQLEEMPGVIAAMVYDKAGRTLAPVSRLHQVPDDALSRRALAAVGLLVQPRGGDVYDLAQPVKVLDAKSGQFKKVGTARLVFSLSEVASVQGGSWRAALISLVLLLAVAAGASLFIMRLVSRPVVRLREEVEAVLKGDQDQAAPPRGFPPLSGLAQSLNRALAKLATLQSAPVAAAAAAPDSLRQDELEALAAVVEHPLLVADADNQVIYANPAFAASQGADLQSLRGRHLLEAMSDRALLAAGLELIKQSGDSGGELARRVVTPEDGPAWAVAARVVPGPGGEPAFTVLAFAPAPDQQAGKED